MIDIKSFLRPGTVICYRFCNADGKAWIIPFRNTRTALELYQPSGIKGIVLKRMFPFFQGFSRVVRVVKGCHGFQRFSRVFKGCQGLSGLSGLSRVVKGFQGLSGLSRVDIDLADELAEAVLVAFKVDDFEFSVFEGTPSVHQKVTIQIFQGNRILGYVKITDSPAIAALFNHEESLLNELHDKGVNDIPHCLYNDVLVSGLYCFIQSTTKTRKSTSPHRWTPLHEHFLTEMHRRTASDILFDNSDFARLIKDMKEHIDYIPEEYVEVVSRNIDDVLARYSTKTVNYSAYHADFTPWNMFVEKKRLFVFDWEYGRMSYPPMLDRYHFIVQQAIHVSHLDASEIRSRLETFDWFSEEDLCFYLLDIISRFTLREGGNVSTSLLSTLKIWTELLSE